MVWHDEAIWNMEDIVHGSEWRTLAHVSTSYHHADELFKYAGCYPSRPCQGDAPETKLLWFSAHNPVSEALFFLYLIIYFLNCR